LPLRSVLAGLALAISGRPLAAQGVHAVEVGIGPLATWSHRTFYGGGIELGSRPGGEGRITVAAAGGSMEGSPALRIEATAQFLVTPSARTGLTPYGGVGLGYVGARAYRGMEVLVLLIGVEQAAGRPSGWFGEVGVGGGLRVRVGFRWRRLSPSWS
jgi:hypothetical protein